MNGTVLIADSNADDRDMLAKHVTQSGFPVSRADTFPALLEEIRQQDHQVVVVGLGIKGGGGVWAVSEIRGHTRAPILAIADDGSEQDRLRSLRVGADVAVSRPLRYQEVALQIRSLARLSAESPDVEPVCWRLRNATLVVDRKRRRALLNRIPVHLTQSEWSLLAYVEAHHDEAVSRDRLLTHCLAYSSPMYHRAVDTHVKNLRRKIGSGWIETVRGYGYQFSLKAEQRESGAVDSTRYLQTPHGFHT